MRWIKTLVPWSGIALFLAIVGRLIWVHGQEWEFSSHGIPVAAVAENGVTYRNGRPIDEVNLFLIHSGIEEKVGAALIAMLLVCFGLFALQMVSVKRSAQTFARCEEMDDVLIVARELEQAGRHQEAREHYQRWEQMLEGVLKRDRLFKRQFDKARRRMGSD